jgi:hypothetical protein
LQLASISSFDARLACGKPAVMSCRVADTDTVVVAVSCATASVGRRTLKPNSGECTSRFDRRSLFSAICRPRYQSSAIEGQRARMRNTRVPRCDRWRLFRRPGLPD